MNNKVKIKLDDLIEVEVESDKLSFDALKTEALALYAKLKQDRCTPKVHDAGVA